MGIGNILHSHLYSAGGWLCAVLAFLAGVEKTFINMDMTESIRMEYNVKMGQTLKRFRERIFEDQCIDAPIRHARGFLVAMMPMICCYVSLLMS